MLPVTLSGGAMSGTQSSRRTLSAMPRVWRTSSGIRLVSASRASDASARAPETACRAPYSSVWPVSVSPMPCCTSPMTCVIVSGPVWVCCMSDIFSVGIWSSGVAKTLSGRINPLSTGSSSLPHICASPPPAVRLPVTNTPSGRFSISTSRPAPPSTHARGTGGFAAASRAGPLSIGMDALARSRC
jgi:hypothetical protein